MKRFGDPKSNPKQLQVRPLGEVCTVERGGSPRPIAKFITESDDGINWIKIGDADGTRYISATADEKKVFEAAAYASNATGLPIYTHTTGGTLALEQAVFFKKRNVNLSKVVIGHMDLSANLDYIRDVIRTGVFVGFDTIGKDSYFPDRKRAEFLCKLEKEGALDHVVLSMDISRRSHLRNNGGYGYTHIESSFIPLLREVGVSEDGIYAMLEKNPRVILGS